MSINRLLNLTSAHQLYPVTLSARKHRELEERLVTTEMVSAVSLRLSRGGPLSAVLADTSSILAGRLGLRFVGIWVNTFDAVLEPIAAVGITKLTLPFHELQRRVEIIAREREPLLIIDPEISDNEQHPRRHFSCAAFPLLACGHLTGVLLGLADHPLGPNTLDRLQAVRVPIALEIELRSRRLRELN